MIKRSFLHTKAIHPDMQVALKPTQHKSDRVFKRSSNLLKGLSVSTIFSLARLHVYMPICFFCAMVGLDITGSTQSLASLLIIGLANTFALVATFAFNDSEDAPEDMLARSVRNVIALGKASKSTGYIIAAIAAVTSLSLSAIAGTIAVLITLAILITGFLYSWRPVRMKAKPFWDVFTHAIVGGLIFLSPAWSTQNGIMLGNHVIPIFLIFSLGTVLALLNHELYEYEDDLYANTRTTVVALGKRKSYWIVGCISILCVSLIINAYLSGIFPMISILSFIIVGSCLM
ncbi:MAG: UbiA family prenyltransferase, partial [Candidatus Scalindua sp.]|nr:UbiA family prenyltransferase [Candidatus Scalindua sp.]